MLDAHLGTIGVWLAFVASLCGAAVMAYGLVTHRHADARRHGGLGRAGHRAHRGQRAGRRRRRACSAGAEPGRVDGRWFAVVMLAGALLAVIAMEHALVTHDFTLVFVAQNNSTVTPLLYSITGMWSALAGSILLWGFVLAVISTLFVLRYRRQAADPVIRWATLVLYVVSAFFFGLMTNPSNPFQTAPGATQGLGPNSLLQDNPLVAIHPPLLYIGFVTFTVPFAFAIGMLATGRVGDRWQIECRRWTLVAFTFLSVGIVLGAWWSYQVLGWGGFWGWDPVENAALLPWLCGTAYLHSVLVQERRGLMRVWNLSLSIATFALTILGTFLTRSGVITSVHSFSESTIGPLLIGFFFVVVIVRVRAHRLAGRPPALAGWHRRAARPGGRVPAEQRGLRRLRLRRAARHPLPAALRRVDPAAGHRRRTLLQHGRHPGRADAALPHGAWPRCSAGAR